MLAAAITQYTFYTKTNIRITLTKTTRGTWVIHSYPGGPSTVWTTRLMFEPSMLNLEPAEFEYPNDAYQELLRNGYNDMVPNDHYYIEGETK